MTNTRTKLTILILLLTLSFSVFAKGDGEGAVVKDKNNEAQMYLTTENYFGSVLFKFHNINDKENITNLVVKKGNQYYDSNNRLLDNQDFYKSKFDNLVVGNTSTIDFEGNEINMGKTEMEFSSSDFNSLSNSSAYINEVRLLTQMQAQDVTIWSISSDGTVSQIKSEFAAPFFEGELEFFNQLFSNSDISYHEKVVFFLSTFLTEEVTNDQGKVISINALTERDNFIRLACSSLNIPNTNNIPSLATLINNTDFDETYSMLKKFKWIFKKAFISHFKIRSEKVISKDSLNQYDREDELIYLDIKKNSFDSIYGEERSPYITAYLSYISSEDNKKSKPILSYLINKSMNSGNKQKVKYDFNQYRQLTVDEGISIARSALMYMTWGVEYTPFNTEQSAFQNGFSASNVYNENILNLENWTLKNDFDLNNMDKYYSTNYINEDLVSIVSKPDNLPNTGLEFLYNKNLITSPFNNKPGNPIPYSPMGIDSPRTFNHKMLKQNEVRLWLVNNHPVEAVDDATRERNFNIRAPYPRLGANGFLETTLVRDYAGEYVQYREGYINENTLYGLLGKDIAIETPDNERKKALPDLSVVEKGLKPYLPGVFLETKKGYSDSIHSTYHPNKVAGVDSLGILMGSIAMSNISGSFPNVYNTEVDRELDDFYKSAPGGGLTGMLEYHTSREKDSILNKPYRFTASDLEKISVLLPDLKMARPGDILVKHIEGNENTDNELHVGIIVSADFSSLGENPTPEDYMKQIKVLSTKRGFKMANVGAWLADEGVFGGFAAIGDEKSYHLRRLLTLTVSKNNINTYQKDAIEMFDMDLYELDIDLDITTGNGMPHWIPNTGELYILNSIQIKGKYISQGSEELTSLRDNESDIILLAPADQYYLDTPDTADTEVALQAAFNQAQAAVEAAVGQDAINAAEVVRDNAQDELEAVTLTNIYSNKGDGIKFYAMDGNHGILLATFKKQDAPQTTNPYSVDYNTEIFDEETKIAKEEDGFSLRIEDDQLVFRINENRYTRFAVRPINNNIRPGDDFLLRFGLSNDEKVMGQAKVEDFLAIYNKKMLWRANLFIDDDNNDWNELNPWNAPVTLDNASNRGISNVGHYTNHGFKDHNLNPDNNEQIWYDRNRWNLEAANGEQVIDIVDWNDRNDVINGNVSYVYGGKDSVFNFNNEMNEQKELLSKWYRSNGGERFLKNRDEWMVDGNIISFDENNKLTDNIYPEEYWTVNYPDADTTQKRITIVQGWTYWDNTRAPDNDWDNYIDTIFRPDQQFSDNADPNNTKHSSIYAGVDCAGLVQHSLLFGATDWDNAVAFHRANAQGVMAPYTAFWYINNPISKSATSMEYNSYSYEIPQIGTDDNNDPIFKHIIPGDIYVQPGHVTIIQDVVFSDLDNRQIDYSNTILIEATPRNTTNTRNLNELPNCDPRRIKE